jgi:antitoxin component of MazEF toxin-antitoxin module
MKKTPCVKPTIGRWGNDLALRIPKAFALKARFTEGTSVVLSLSEGSLVIRRSNFPRRSLGELLSEVDSANLSPKPFGDQVRGKEAW